MDISKDADVPRCSDESVIEKLKITVSASIAGEKYAANIVDSVFDVHEIDTPTDSSRSCRAGLRAEGSSYSYVNYVIALAANGSKEKFALNTSFE